MNRRTETFPYIVEQLQQLALPVAELALDDKNARWHSDRNLGAIRASLEAHKQRKPIVVQRNEEGALIVRAGNGTLRAARELGWSHIAAVVIEESTQDARVYGLRDNRTGELASWDSVALAEVLQDLEDDENFVGLDEDLWNPEELNALIADGLPDIPRVFLASDEDSGTNWRPDDLPASDVAGVDTRNGRFFLTFSSEEERLFWCEALRVKASPSRFVWTREAIEAEWAAAEAVEETPSE